MSNFGFVAPGSTPAHVAHNARGVVGQKQRAEIPGPWVYVLTGDIELDTGDSPEWLNDFYFLSPVAFRHGLDGQTDMIGVYDLTLGAVSGGIAFMMANRWAMNAPLATAFPVELATDVWSIAIQKIDPNDPDATATHVPVRIYWPIVADLVP